MATDSSTTAATATATGIVAPSPDAVWSIIPAALAVGFNVGSYISSCVAVFGIALLAGNTMCKTVTPVPVADRGDTTKENEHYNFVAMCLFVPSILLHIFIIIVIANEDAYSYMPFYLFPLISVLGLLIVYVCVAMTCLAYSAVQMLVQRVRDGQDRGRKPKGVYAVVATEEQELEEGVGKATEDSVDSNVGEAK